MKPDTRQLTTEDLGFECNDPECWCCMADEIRKNDDMDVQGDRSRPRSELSQGLPAGETGESGTEGH